MVGEVNVPAIVRRILVAEVDDDTRELYRETLRRARYEVLEATDGREALTKALTQRPTAVLTGLRLPLVDGYALCETLRHDSETAFVPILVVTLESHPVALEHARRVGADCVLPKPPERGRILSELDRLIRRSSQWPERTMAPDHAAPTGGYALPARHRRVALSKQFVRFTTTMPPATPPELLCPSCHRPLSYIRSHIGGVSSRCPEQWDEFTCSAKCGTFEYRHRTRALRRVQMTELPERS